VTISDCWREPWRISRKGRMGPQPAETNPKPMGARVQRIHQAFPSPERAHDEENTKPQPLGVCAPGSLCTWEE